MPSIIEYQSVLQQLQSEGLKSNYYNSGSFSFPKESNPKIRGWLGPPDGTIRPEMKSHIRHVPQPFEANLAVRAAAAWQQFLPGNVWVMPASHWSFELTHGNQHWLPGLLTSINIDPGLLIQRTSGDAIQFLQPEEKPFLTLIEGLLHGLTASDFTLIFPGRRAICTLHHHKQLWWVTPDELILRSLDDLG